jgi:hypothetical protein
MSRFKVHCASLVSLQGKSRVPAEANFIQNMNNMNPLRIRFVLGTAGFLPSSWGEKKTSVLDTTPLRLLLLNGTGKPFYPGSSTKVSHILTTGVIIVQ